MRSQAGEYRKGTPVRHDDCPAPAVLLSQPRQVREIPLEIAPIQGGQAVGLTMGMRRDQEVWNQMLCMSAFLAVLNEDLTRKTGGVGRNRIIVNLQPGEDKKGRFS